MREASNLPPTWTAERVEMLKTLWSEGRSAGQIAAQMACGFSRSAVIGKVHRLGLTARRTGGTTTSSIATKARNAKVHGNRNQPKVQNIIARVAARRAEPKFEAGPLPEEELGNDVTPLIGSVLGLTQHTCKWPIGDPLLPGFGFCGRSPRVGSPYCDDHYKRGTRHS